MLAARHVLLAAALATLATTAGAEPENGQGRPTGVGGAVVELLHLQELIPGSTLGFQSGDRARLLTCEPTGGPASGSLLGPSYAVSATAGAIEFFGESEDGTGRSTGGGGTVSRVGVPLSNVHAPLAANPVRVTTAVRHGLMPGDEVLIEGSAMVELNGRTFTVNTSAFISPALSFVLVGENGIGRTTGAGGTVNIPSPTVALSSGVPPTSTNPVVVTTASPHPYVNRDQVTFQNSGMAQLNGATFSVSVIDETRFELFTDLPESDSYLEELRLGLLECEPTTIDPDDQNAENYYGRLLYDTAREVALSSTVAPTTTNPVVITTEVPHGFARCAEVIFSGYFGSRMPQINRRPYFVVNPTPTTFELYNTSCPLPSNATGTTVTRGVLSATDPLGTDWGLGDDATQFVDAYEITVEEGGTVALTMRSSSVDTRLWLLDHARNAVAEDDDGSGGSDAVLAATDLAAGTYTVLASSHGEGEMGPYTLPEPTSAALQLAAAAVLVGLARARRRGR